MEHFIVPSEWLKEITDTQQKILSLLQNLNNSSLTGDFIPESEAKKILNKKTTWFWMLRKSGQLPFTKLGKTIYYSKTDIQNLLEKHKHKSNQKNQSFI